MPKDRAERNRARTLHFMTHWGVPKEIHPFSNPLVSKAAIIEFGPRRMISGYHYATNGMSEYLQRYKNGHTRTELYASSKEEAPWVIDLLKGLIQYPKQHETNFAIFDTVAAGQSIDKDCSPFDSILLAAPEPQDSSSLGVISNVAPEKIMVYHVVGITHQECRFAINNGGEALWHKLLALQREFFIDEARHSAV